MEVSEGSVCLPGDVLGRVPQPPPQASSSSSSSSSAGDSQQQQQQNHLLRIGPGLAQGDGERIVATRAGTVRYRPRHSYWDVDASRATSQRRYVPALEDVVVGVCVGRAPGAGGDAVHVDVGSAALATLSLYAFEGATKHSRPRVAAGAVLYARVVAAGRDVDPELACVSLRKRADGFGELAGGTLLRTSLAHARALLAPECAVLRALGELLPYEVAVGLNGRVWVKAACPAHTILVANAIANAELLAPAEARAMVAALWDRFGN